MVCYILWGWGMWIGKLLQGKGITSMSVSCATMGVLRPAVAMLLTQVREKSWGGAARSLKGIGSGACHHNLINPLTQHPCPVTPIPSQFHSSHLSSWLTCSSRWRESWQCKWKASHWRPSNLLTQHTAGKHFMVLVQQFLAAPAGHHMIGPKCF